MSYQRVNGSQMSQEGRAVHSQNIGSLAGTIQHEYKTRALGQYPTPAWVAAALVREHFSDLGQGDVMCDPFAGPGRFLQAVPDDVVAIGVEVDPVVAEQARALTGRTIITGDFMSVDLPERPTAFIGNPPFRMTLVDRFLGKAHDMLPEEGRVGFILPAYALQTAARVVRYTEDWSLQQQMIPRNIYPGLSKPLIFALFRKDKRRLTIGFSLYHEAAHVLALPKPDQDALNEGPATWSTLVLGALRRLGGRAHLKELYEALADQRPSHNPHWREQIRKICQQRAERVGPGTYQIDIFAGA